MVGTPLTEAGRVRECVAAAGAPWFCGRCKRLEMEFKILFKIKFRIRQEQTIHAIHPSYHLSDLNGNRGRWAALATLPGMKLRKA